MEDLPPIEQRPPVTWRSHGPSRAPQPAIASAAGAGREPARPHKPLLLLWLFGRFATSGTTLVSYREAEEPVSRLINDFGPPVTSQSRARQRAAMPFVHLERELWDLRDEHGRELGPEVPERRSWLIDQDAVGRLRPEVEQLLADTATLAAAARQLLDLHFTPTLASLICDAVDLDLAALEASSLQPPTRARRRPRRPGFAEEVLRAYGYACAVCGFDGALGRNPVAWGCPALTDRADGSVRLPA